MTVAARINACHWQPSSHAPFQGRSPTEVCCSLLLLQVLGRISQLLASTVEWIPVAMAAVRTKSHWLSQGLLVLSGLSVELSSHSRGNGKGWEGD